MTVENPYIARTKLKRLRKYLPVSLNHAGSIKKELEWDTPLEYTPVLKLDQDINIAMQKMNDMEKLEATLPGLDCGSCGAPTCHALAEDVVRGVASPDECIYRYKENMNSLIFNLQKLNRYIPEHLRKPENDSENNGEGEETHDTNRTGKPSEPENR